MAQRYVRRAIPIEAWNNFKRKQDQMQKSFAELFGKMKRIPLTKIMIADSAKPLFLTNDQLKSMGKWKQFKI